MISIETLGKFDRSDLIMLREDESHKIHGGLTPVDSGIGAAAGAIGGGLGQAGYNAATGQPLHKGVLESVAINAVVGAINPLGGAATFVGGVVKATGGSTVGAILFDTKPAIGSRTSSFGLAF